MLWPSMLDIVLWDVWERVECPVLILRGETSDLLLPSTVERMKQRGIAASRRQVESVEVPDCGHAPSLMDLDQIRLIEEFLLRKDENAQAKRA
jgi:pimeloyl-ACP methyl ester carboxylesterase